MLYEYIKEFCQVAKIQNDEFGFRVIQNLFFIKFSKKGLTVYIYIYIIDKNENGGEKMKKKILKLFILLAVVALLLVCLTGCENDKEDDDNDRKNDDAEEVVDEDYELYDNQNQGTVEISEIVYRFDGGIAIVKDENNNWFAINEKGEIVLELPIAEGREAIDLVKEDVTCKNGYIKVDTHSTGNSIKYYDKNGKEILNDLDEDTKIISDISKSGYYWVTKESKTLAGNEYTYSIQDLDGNIIKDFGKKDSNSYAKLVGGDIFYGYLKENEEETDEETYIEVDNGKHFLLDAKSGKEIEAEGQVENFRYVGYGWYLGWGVGSDDIIFKDNLEEYHELSSWRKDMQIINEKYYIERGSDTAIIRSMDGEEVKDLSEGEAKNIAYFDGVYYVISKTDFCYTLDENFDYILEPKEFNSGHIVGVTSDGVVVCQSDEDGNIKYYITNKNFEVEKELDIENKKANWTNLEEILTNFDGLTEGDFLYSSKGIYDVKNEKKLVIKYK